MRHLAVSTRFTNRLEDRYVPVKHKLRAIRDLRPWGKLHLAQFSTTWKLDWELTIDEPSTCSTSNTERLFRFALSRNRMKRIQSTSFAILLPFSDPPPKFGNLSEFNLSKIPLPPKKNHRIRYKGNLLISNSRPY